MLLMLITALATSVTSNDAPQLKVVGDWQIQVSPGVVTIRGEQVALPQSVTLTVAPATLVRVKDERYDNLPLFNDKAAPWIKGVKLRQLVTFETTAPDMLVPESFALKSAPGNTPKFQAGTDYALEARWATLGRLPNGGILENQPVWADYELGRSRIDAVVVNRKGEVSLRQSAPHNATPLPPQPAQDEVTLANIWVPGRLSKLTDENLYPILEPKYRRQDIGATSAAKLLPKMWAKLHDGQPLHVLAWGDSVTAGGQASDEAHRYQNRFVTLLKQRFPKASIRLTTAGWGGRNSDSFLKEPPGAEFNFERAVIAPRPDLIVMEFVNDAYMTPEIVEQKYSYLLKRFQDIGAEWIILTPHYVRPDWMGVNTVRVETDPRPYVAGLRQFAAKHRVALADASLRWGHLLKEGIPYVTLLSNSINHPDDRGHELFAQALMELFGS
jgi:lysophospholipase L1-like esterase